jgi:LacI family transcriptional regulator
MLSVHRRLRAVLPRISGLTVVTIKDVAARAGVSPKTVSRVINGEAHVRADKREQVLRVVRELDYRPNAFARSLSSSRSYLLGLLTDDPGSGYAADVQLGALKRCRERSYHLLVEPIDRSDPHWARELGGTLTTLRLDGVMLTPPLCDDADVLKVLEAADLPYVRISPSGEEDRSGYVRMDDQAAAAEMTRHLIARDHKRIGFIKGDPTHSASRKRFAGFVEAMIAAHLPIDPSIIVEGDFSVRSGVELGEKLLSAPERPTAIFASNDDMALGVLMVAMKHHLAVPDDLAIAGFDDAPTSRLAWPQLTTIHQPKAAMAAAAVDMLTDPYYRQAENSVGFRRSLDYQLRIRGSTVPEA